jgi:hypothetical protein
MFKCFGRRPSLWTRTLSVVVAPRSSRRALFRSPTAASLGPSYRERSPEGVDSGPAVTAAAGAAGPEAEEMCIDPAPAATITRVSRCHHSFVRQRCCLAATGHSTLAFHAKPIIIPRYVYLGTQVPGAGILGYKSQVLLLYTYVNITSYKIRPYLCNLLSGC